jgi:hypothetical protein
VPPEELQEIDGLLNFAAVAARARVVDHREDELLEEPLGTAFEKLGPK